MYGWAVCTALRYWAGVSGAEIQPGFIASTVYPWSHVCLQEVAFSNSSTQRGYLSLICAKAVQKSAALCALAVIGWVQGRITN